MKGIVNAIDGVEINVPERMYYSDPKANPPLNIDLQTGTQVLYGEEAHDFLRYRGYADADIGRIKAQQYFIKEVVKQTLKPKNISNLPKLIEEYYKNVETNIPLTTILKGIASLNKIDIDNANMMLIPGTSEKINGIWYYIYDKIETKEVIEENLRKYLSN